MAHARQQIREQVGTTVSGLTTTGTRVYQSRVHNLAEANLPGLLVYTTAEESSPDSFGVPRSMTRNLTLVIEGYAKTATNLDDTLDTIASEVEAAMAGDRTVTGWAVTSHLTGTEISLTGDGDQPVGVVSMSYLVTYRTSDLDPDTSLQ
jgi:hypothetical protein